LSKGAAEYIARDAKDYDQYNEKGDKRVECLEFSLDIFRMAMKQHLSKQNRFISSAANWPD
jgi:hypothetical protein